MGQAPSEVNLHVSPLVEKHIRCFSSSFSKELESDLSSNRSHNISEEFRDKTPTSESIAFEKAPQVSNFADQELKGTYFDNKALSSFEAINNPNSSKVIDFQNQSGSLNKSDLGASLSQVVINNVQQGQPVLLGTGLIQSAIDPPTTAKKARPTADQKFSPEQTPSLSIKHDDNKSTDGHSIQLSVETLNSVNIDFKQRKASLPVNSETILGKRVASDFDALESQAASSEALSEKGLKTDQVLTLLKEANSSKYVSHESFDKVCSQLVNVTKVIEFLSVRLNTLEQEQSSLKMENRKLRSLIEDNKSPIKAPPVFPAFATNSKPSPLPVSPRAPTKPKKPLQSAFSSKALAEAPDTFDLTFGTSSVAQPSAKVSISGKATPKPGYSVKSGKALSQFSETSKGSKPCSHMTNHNHHGLKCKQCQQKVQQLKQKQEIEKRLLKKKLYCEKVKELLKNKQEKCAEKAERMSIASGNTDKEAKKPWKG